MLQSRVIAIAPRGASREPPRQGDGEEARRCVVCSSRRVAWASGRAARLGCQGDPRNSARRLRPRPVPGEPATRVSVLRTDTRAHVAACARVPPAPMGGHAGWELHGTNRRVRPGWVLRFTGDDGEASGSAARLHRFSALRVQAREAAEMGVSAALAAAEGSGNGSPADTPDASRYIGRRFRKPFPAAPLFALQCPDRPPL